MYPQEDAEPTRVVQGGLRCAVGLKFMSFMAAKRAAAKINNKLFGKKAKHQIQAAVTTPEDMVKTLSTFGDGAAEPLKPKPRRPFTDA